MYEVFGKIHRIFETRTVGNNIRMREIVVIVSQNYRDQMLKFRLLHEQCDLISFFNVGDLVNINFSIEGKEIIRKDENGNPEQDKEPFYFVDLRVVNIAKSKFNKKISKEEKDLEPTDEAPY